MTDICLPVSRYSYANGLSPSNTVPWTHVSSSNLFIILKGTDKHIKDEKLTLRMVQGNEVLESLNLGSYIDQAASMKRSVEGTAITLRTEQLPIFFLTRDAIVAIRYTLGDGQPRRIQMRMHSAADCRQIVQVFLSRGMEFMTQPPGAARPDTARPLTVNSQLTAPKPSSPYFKAAQQPTRNPFTPQVVEAGSLSQVRQTSPTRPKLEVEAPFQQRYTDTQQMRPPLQAFTRDEIAAPREVVPTRPSTAQIYRSYSIQPQPSGFDANDDMTHQAHKFGLARPSSTSNTAAADAISQAIEQYHSSPHSTVQAPHAPAEDRANGNSGNITLQTHDTSETARPSTSSSFVFADTLEHEIPPRRELPFARPDSRRSGSDTTSSRPRSALTLPPLPLPKPRPSPQKPGSSSFEMRPPSRPISPARPQTSSPLKRSFADMNEPTAPAAERPSTASPSKPISPARIASPQAPAKKQSRMEELLHGRKLALEGSAASTAKRTDSLADAPGEEDDSFVSNEPSPTKTNMRCDSLSPLRHTTNAARDPTANAYAAISSAVAGDSSLRKYAEQSLEDRQAALDEFMVQNLENPDFTKLCKDVENCWRRIALGL